MVSSSDAWEKRSPSPNPSIRYPALRRNPSIFARFIWNHWSHRNIVSREGESSESVSSDVTIPSSTLQIAIGNGHQGHIRRPVENIFSGQQILFHGVLDMSLHRI